MIEVARYLKQYYRPSASAVEVTQSSYQSGDRSLPATIYRPRARRTPGPAWVVLHGLTYHGPGHPALQRFASALAASGNVVIIPEISEWTRLIVAPDRTPAAIRASADVLRQRDDVDDSRIGVFGFSFGATQALVAAHQEPIKSRIKTVVAWGGYADLGRLIHFGLTGEHELDGVREHIDVDPYGRWMFGGNYLTSIPGYEDMGAVANALMEIAREAGRSHTFAGDPVHNPLKLKWAETLNAREREVYEMFAPTREARDMERARTMAAMLTETIAAKDPLMDPQPYFGRVGVPVVLTHGKEDRLVPYTETIRMQRYLPAEMVAGCTITSLFAHSGGSRPMLHPVRLSRELATFLGMLNRILTIL